MGTFNLNSDKLFLRSVGKSQVMVVKLTKDVHSNVVETKDWEVIDIIGSDNISYDSLEIFSHKIQGKKLKNLAMNLCESRLWVNREGSSFIRLGINSLSFHVVFYKNNDLFDWNQFWVNDDDNEEDNKSLDDLKRELKEYKDKVRVKDDEIKKLKEEIQDTKDQSKKDDDNLEIKKLQGKLDKSSQDYNKLVKDFDAKKQKVTQLEDELKEKGKEISHLNDELKKAKTKKDEFDAKNHKVTHLEN